MKIIRTGKRAAPPKADMFLPRWVLVFIILTVLSALVLIVLGVLTEDWYNLIMGAVYLPFALLLFLWWKNQSIKILDEDTFRYTNMFGKKSIHSFSRIRHIRVYLTSISVLVGRKRIFVDGGARVTQPLADKFNIILERQGKRYRVGKLNKKRMILVIIIAAFVGGLSGFFSSGVFGDTAPPVDKTFSDDGMSITLTDEFLNTTWAVDDEAGYNAVYSDGTVTVLSLKEEFSLLAGFEEYTLEEYANLTLEGNGMVTEIHTDENGQMYFDYLYEDSETGDSYYYYAYVFKSGDAFWLVQFATPEKDAADYADDIVRWADSVTFDAGVYVEGPHSGVEGDVI